MALNGSKVQWTHSICEDCWDKRNPDRPAFRTAPYTALFRMCCFCGKNHASGILVREDGRKLACEGMAHDG